MDQRDDAVGFVQGIHASGGTNIGAALGAANAIMGHDPRYIHHVILLSDGVSAPEPTLAAAQTLAGRGVSSSAITIGPRKQLMADIARIGHGRYHVTNSAGSLPSLFVREAQFRQPAHRRGSFSPTTAYCSTRGCRAKSGPRLAVFGADMGSLARLAAPIRSAPEPRTCPPTPGVHVTLSLAQTTPGGIPLQPLPGVASHLVRACERAGRSSSATAPSRPCTTRPPGSDKLAASCDRKPHGRWGSPSFFSWCFRA